MTSAYVWSSAVVLATCAPVSRHRSALRASEEKRSFWKTQLNAVKPRNCRVERGLGEGVLPEGGFAPDGVRDERVLEVGAPSARARRLRLARARDRVVVVVVAESRAERVVDVWAERPVAVGHLCTLLVVGEEEEGLGEHGQHGRRARVTARSGPALCSSRSTWL